MFSGYLKKIISKELERIFRYADLIVGFDSSSDSKSTFLGESAVICDQLAELGSVLSDKKARNLVFLGNSFNHSLDIQKDLSEIFSHCSRHTRLVSVLCNPVHRYLHQAIARFRGEDVPQTFLTEADLAVVAKIAKFELVRLRPVACVPFGLFGLGTILNKFLGVLPGIRRLGLYSVAVFRPVVPEKELPSLSVLIPARDEKGNIENALKRMPDFGGAPLEIIFVEGHSSDGTWEEIQRVAKEYADQFNIKIFRQDGVGKANAVRLGFKQAECDLLTILDADLTMPPELLPRFYEAYCRGDADFINGSRLLYPIEGQGMRFLNRIGNGFFAYALSFLMDTRISDSLCGTKLFARRDYERMCAWRNDFGDIDPFGDFELLFPAAVFGLGIVDIPIRYRDREYGSTSIQRFRHGFMLLKMSYAALTRLKATS